MAFQDSLGDSGPFGESPFSPFPSLACSHLQFFQSTKDILSQLENNPTVLSVAPSGVVPVLAGLLGLAEL